MKVVAFDDPGAFAEENLELWLSNEAENAAFLRIERTAPVSEDCAEEEMGLICLAVVDDDEKVVQTACVVPDEQIVMSAADEPALSALSMAQNE